MAKLQKIVRPNGSEVHLFVVPKEEVEKADLQKGDSCDIFSIGPGLLRVKSMEDRHGHNHK